MRSCRWQIFSVIIPHEHQTRSSTWPSAVCFSISERLFLGGPRKSMGFDRVFAFLSHWAKQRAKNPKRLGKFLTIRSNTTWSDVWPAEGFVHHHEWNDFFYEGTRKPMCLTSFLRSSRIGLTNGAKSQKDLCNFGPIGRL